MRQYLCIYIMAFAAACSLAGCGSDGRTPSDRDIESALRASFEQAKERMAKMGGGRTFGFEMEVHKVNSFGCVKSENQRGYNCDIEADITVPLRGRHKVVRTLRFIETDQGWRVVP